MKVVIQRVSQARVVVKGKTISAIEKGALLLICFEKGDESLDLSKTAKKLCQLRYFSDQETGKMKCDVNQVGGSLLCVSQFTLSWEGTKGNRPGFDNSMAPQKAAEMMDNLTELMGEICTVKKGVFGAHMEISLINDGPVTFSLRF